MEIPTCKGTSTRSGNSAAHLHIIANIQVSQHSRGHVFEKQFFAFACLPSRPNDLLLLWPSASFAEAGSLQGAVGARRSFCLVSLILKVIPLVLPILQACTVFFPGFPGIVFCLPQSGSAFLVACFKTYFRETSRFSLSNLSTTSMSTMTRAVTFQIIFHCIHYRFSTGSIHYLQMPTNLVSMALFCFSAENSCHSN